MSSRFILGPLALAPAFVGVVMLGVLWQVHAEPAQPAKPVPRPTAPVQAPVKTPAAKPTSHTDSHDVGPSMYA